MDNSSVFSQDRVPGTPGRWALGLWLTNRKLASAAWVPGQKFRNGMIGRQPYWQPFNFPSLAANTNAEDRISVTNDFWVVALMACGVQAGAVHQNFNMQIFNSGEDEPWQYTISPAGSVAGLASQPFLLRRPQLVRGGTPMLCRVYNQQPGANSNIQVVMYGVLGEPQQ